MRYLCAWIESKNEWSNDRLDTIIDLSKVSDDTHVSVCIREYIHDDKSDAAMPVHYASYQIVMGDLRANGVRRSIRKASKVIFPKIFKLAANNGTKVRIQIPQLAHKAEKAPKVTANVAATTPKSDPPPSEHLYIVLEGNNGGICELGEPRDLNTFEVGNYYTVVTQIRDGDGVNQKSVRGSREIKFMAGTVSTVDRRAMRGTALHFAAVLNKEFVENYNKAGMIINVVMPQFDAPTEDDEVSA